MISNHVFFFGPAFMADVNMYYKRVISKVKVEGGADEIHPIGK